VEDAHLKEKDKMREYSTNRLATLLRTGLVTVAIAVMLATGAMVATSGSTAAAAAPWDYEYCDPAVNGIMFCVDVKGVANYTQTPSGNLAYIDNGEACLWFTDGVQIFTESCTKFNFANLSKQDEQHVFHGVINESTTYDGQTCMVTVNAAYVNGEIRHEVIRAECG
jgi:hypothetical protein